MHTGAPELANLFIYRCDHLGFSLVRRFKIKRHDPAYSKSQKCVRFHKVQEATFGISTKSTEQVSIFEKGAT
jgi:hypothetical protein